METFKSKVSEIISSKQSIVSYQVQFSEQYQSNTNLQYSENSNIMSSMKYFIKHDKVFHIGQTFYILKMDSFIDGNQQNDVNTSLLLTILNHTIKLSSPSENEVVIMNVYDMVGELWECNKTWGPCFDFINSCLTSSTTSGSISSSNVLVLMNNNNNKTTTTTDGKQQQQNGFDGDYMNNFPHHFLLEIDDTASDYSLDGGLWSISLFVNSPVTPTIITTTITTQSNSEPNVSENDVKTDVSQIETNRVSNVLVEEHEQHNDTDNDGDWEMVTDDLADLHIVERIDYTTTTSPPPVTTTAIQQTTKTADQQTSLELPTLSSSTSLTFTYKDMVLKPATPKSTYSIDMDHNHHHEDNHQISLHDWKERQCQQQKQQHEWKPHVVLIKTPYIRQDREYGSQPEMLIDDEGE